jgi:hypothetical protein
VISDQRRGLKRQGAKGAKGRQAQELLIFGFLNLVFLGGLAVKKLEVVSEQ